MQVYYVLDHPKSKDWKGGVGYVTAEIAKASLLQVSWCFSKHYCVDFDRGTTKCDSQSFCKWMYSIPVCNLDVHDRGAVPVLTSGSVLSVNSRAC